MSLFYYINLVKHKNFDYPRLLECLIIWNRGSTYHSISSGKISTHWFSLCTLQVKKKLCKLIRGRYIGAQYVLIPFLETKK